MCGETGHERRDQRAARGIHSRQSRAARGSRALPRPKQHHGRLLRGGHRLRRRPSASTTRPSASPTRKDEVHRADELRRELLREEDGLGSVVFESSCASSRTVCRARDGAGEIGREQSCAQCHNNPKSGSQQVFCERATCLPVVGQSAAALQHVPRQPGAPMKRRLLTTLLCALRAPRSWAQSRRPPRAASISTTQQRRSRATEILAPNASKSHHREPRLRAKVRARSIATAKSAGRSASTAAWACALQQDTGDTPAANATTPNEITNYLAVGLEPEEMTRVIAGQNLPRSLLILAKPLMLESHKRRPRHRADGRSRGDVHHVVDRRRHRPARRSPPRVWFLVLGTESPNALARAEQKIETSPPLSPSPNWRAFSGSRSFARASAASSVNTFEWEFDKSRREESTSAARTRFIHSRIVERAGARDATRRGHESA